MARGWPGGCPGRSNCEESTGECIEVEYTASDSEDCDAYSAVDQLEATAVLQQSGQLTLEQALGELLEIVDSMHPNGDADDNMKTVAVAIESFIQMYTPETSPSYVATVLAADVLLENLHCLLAPLVGLLFLWYYWY